MTELFWHAGWTFVLSWMTYAVAHSVLMGRRIRPPEGRIRKFHDRIMQPVGAVLTFVFAYFMVSAAWGFLQVIARGH